MAMPCGALPGRVHCRFFHQGATAEDASGTRPLPFLPSGSNGGGRVRDASGTRPFLQILSCGTRPGRVRCRFSQYLRAIRGAGQ
eukprot:gene14362-biopygen21632